MIDLYMDDCLEVMKKIPDGSVDLVVTDPPYKIVSGGCATKGSAAMGGVLSRGKAAVRAGKIFKCNDIAFSEWVPEVYRVLRPNTHCYIMVSARNLMELWAECEKVGFAFQNLLVWDKGNVTPNRYYMGAYELILMLRKGRAKTINNRGAKNILSVKNPVGVKTHPTEKPVELMQILVENSTVPGECVLDLFMGTGSTGVTCVNTGRRFIGIEMDENYFSIARERIEKCKSAQLLSV